MQIIIDTHIFLWYISGDSKLKSNNLELISDTSNEIFLSVASIWECIIKQKIGKLDLPISAAKYLSSKRMEHNIVSLPIEENTINHLSGLPELHRDPFDRIILCQCLDKGYKILTEDQILKNYPYPIFI